MKTVTKSNANKLLERMVKPLGESLSLRAAKTVLKLNIPDEDQDRMEHLVSKAKRGKLTLVERHELDEYLLVGNLLDKLHAQAHVAFKRPTLLSHE